MSQSIFSPLDARLFIVCVACGSGVSATSGQGNHSPCHHLEPELCDRTTLSATPDRFRIEEQGDKSRTGFSGGRSRIVEP